jgi:hypothetical protein
MLPNLNACSKNYELNNLHFLSPLLNFFQTHQKMYLLKTENIFVIHFFRKNFRNRKNLMTGSAILSKKTKERPVTKKYGTFHHTNQNDFFSPAKQKASGEKYRNQNSAPYFIEHEVEKRAQKSFSLSTRVIPVHFFKHEKERKRKTLTSFLAGGRKQA